MEELWAIALTLGFVSAGFVLAIAAKHFFGVDNSGLSISLLVVPFVIYLLASGRIGEFEGFGVKASFQVLANAKLSEAAVGLDLISPEKPSLQAITEMEQALVQLGGADSVVFIHAGQSYTQAERVAKASLIKNSLLASKLRFVVVIDDKGRPLGYFRPDYFLDLVHLPLDFTMYPDAGEPDEGALYREMMQTIFWDIIENPAMRAENWGEQLFVSPTESLAGAFRRLREAASEGALVTNQRGEYRGFVTADSLQKQLTLALLDATGTDAR